MSARSMLSRDTKANERSKGVSVWLDKDASLEEESLVAGVVVGGGIDVLVTATNQHAR